MRIRFAFISALLILLVPGCMKKAPIHYAPESQSIVQARLFYAHLDRAVATENNQNARGNRIKGFPFLRTNRFLTHLKGRLNTRTQKKDWVTHLQALDLSARKSEIRTLTDAAVRSLINALDMGHISSRQDLIRHLKPYSDRLLAQGETNAEFYNTLIQRTRSPDEYSGVMRIFGGYPLAYGPILYFTRRSYGRMEQTHQQPLSALKVRGHLVQYTPKANSRRTRTSAQDIFSTTPKDSLGIHRFTPDNLFLLAAWFAPVYTQDTAGQNDLFGRVVWQKNRVDINPEKPSVYYYFSYAALNQTPVFQINYVIWFSSREGPDVPWYEKGRLDGFNVRVTLDPAGVPIMVDMVHNCGCYHFFVPKKEWVSAIKPFANLVGTMVPAWMPRGFPEKRLALRISSGRHQVENVGIQDPSAGAQPYDLIPYKTLEALKQGPGTHKSIFDPRGIVKGTQRIEPYLLFSAGIPEIGAMRQRTRQATRLIGREHFDNPLIFTNHFEFRPFQSE